MVIVLKHEHNKSLKFASALSALRRTAFPLRSKAAA
jgi:hypothetical protein